MLRLTPMTPIHESLPVVHGFSHRQWESGEVSVWDGDRFISGSAGSAWLADRLLDPNAEQLRVPWSFAGGAAADALAESEAQAKLEASVLDGLEAALEAGDNDEANGKDNDDDIEEIDYVAENAEQGWESRCLECSRCKDNGYKGSNRRVIVMCHEHQKACLAHVHQLRAKARANPSLDIGLRARAEAFREIRKRKEQEQSSGSVSTHVRTIRLMDL